MRRRTERNRPKVLEKAIGLYDSAEWYPSRVKVSFEDGTTAIYERTCQQPHPAVLHCISIIQDWRCGYPGNIGERVNKDRNW